jgi:hypothetical protein
MIGALPADTMASNAFRPFGVMGTLAITISQVGGHPPHIATPNHTN